jgi:outer membrane protein OmpA-like peptidoglycan-associated protein
MNRMPVQITRAVAWLLSLAVMVGGCVSAEKQQAGQDQLGRAQTAYRQAQADPNVQSFAQLPLLDAQKALEAATQAKEVQDIQHLGYVAERKAQTASAIGQARKLEQETQQLSKETADILMQRRERELKAVRAEAEARGREAEQARQAAEARAREAEQAQAQIGQTRTELEAQARQVEQARQAAEARAREVEQARVQVELARMETEAKAREAEQARVQAATAQAEAAALTKEVTELKGKQTERGVVLTISDVFFSIGKADIAPGAQRSVDKLAALLQKYPNRNVLIEGHTDSTGSEQTNLELSQKRADAVKDLLVAKGISPDRIGTKGYGLQYPVAPNDTPSGRQQNRRVEVVILDEGVSSQRTGR